MFLSSDVLVGMSQASQTCFSCLCPSTSRRQLKTSLESLAEFVVPVVGKSSNQEVRNPYKSTRDSLKNKQNRKNIIRIRIGTRIVHFANLKCQSLISNKEPNLWDIFLKLKQLRKFVLKVYIADINCLLLEPAGKSRSQTCKTLLANLLLI